MIEERQQLAFSVLQEAIRQARYNALKTANAELVNLYWQIGAFVSKQLKQSEWGEKTVQQFSDHLRKHEPSLKGFDRKSVYRMVQFYESYRTAAFVGTVEPQLQAAGNQPSEIVAPVGRQLKEKEDTKIVSLLKQQLFAENIQETILTKISWTHNRTIFSRCRLDEEREFYIRMSIRDRYAKRELDRQISAGLFERTMMSNQQLSPSLKEGYPDVLNTLKDRYVFEFLNLTDEYSEGDLQKGLIRQIKNFILELGKDFLFMGEEFKVQVGNRDFNIDLLFYHRGLQCLVAFELKKERFEPEHLGKLNFYLEALDRDVKKENENPSIGVLLCKDKDTEVVEYALSRSLSPTMVAEYQLQLPDKKLLQQKLHELFQNSTDIDE